MPRGCSLALLGRVVDPSGEIYPGEVRIDGPTIVSVTPGRSHAPADRVIDAGDAYLFPGAIDAHVHCLSEVAEGVATTTRSAVAGGVTTVVEMPYDAEEAGGPVWDLDSFHAKIGLVRAEAHVDVALLATVRPEGGAADVADLAAAGACGFKISIFDTDPKRFPRIPDVELLDVLGAAANTARRVMVHAENDEIIKPLIARMRAAGHTGALDHCRSRPPVSETDGVLKVLEFAHATGAAVHLCHLSLDRSVELARWYVDHGDDVSVETCPHYLTFTEDDMERLGARIKINPPVRAPAERDALWARLAAGDIDLISSDHAPWQPERKAHAHDIFANSSGSPGIETLVNAIAGEALQRRKMSPARLASLLSGRPAQLFGLADRKGALTAGKDADVMVFDPAVEWVLDESALHSSAGWSPYNGMSLQGKVTTVVAAGQVVVEEGGHPLTSAGQGRFLRPA
jgi:allantoinase